MKRKVLFMLTLLLGIVQGIFADAPQVGDIITLHAALEYDDGSENDIEFTAKITEVLSSTYVKYQIGDGINPCMDTNVKGKIVGFQTSDYQTHISCTPVAIAENAFKGCSQLTGITILSSIKAIGENAFVGCVGLQEVNIKGNYCRTIPDNAFPASVYETATLCVQPGYIRFFNNNDGWKNFINIKEKWELGQQLSLCFSSNDNTADTRLTCQLTQGQAWYASWDDDPVEIVRVAIDPWSTADKIYIPGEVLGKPVSLLAGTYYSLANKPHTPRTVVLPPSIDYIEGPVFVEYTTLDTLILCGTPPTWLDGSHFDESHFSHVKVIVPERYLSMYKQDMDWGRFTNIETTNKMEYFNFVGHNQNGVMLYYTLYSPRNPELCSLGRYIPKGGGRITNGPAFTRSSYIAGGTAGSYLGNYGYEGPFVISKEFSRILLNAGTCYVAGLCYSEALRDIRCTSISFPQYWNETSAEWLGYKLGYDLCTEILVDEANVWLTSVDGVLFSKDRTKLLAYPGKKEGDSYSIPHGTTELANYAFYNCNNLRTISIPEGVTTMKNAIIGCESLESIHIPASLTSDYINFGGCYNLSRITVAAGNPKLDSRNNCNAIIETATNKLIVGCKTTVIPDNVVTIGNSALSRLKISHIDIPQSVTTIEKYAFYDTPLEEVTIPTGVKTIGSGAFIDGAAANATAIKVTSLIEEPFEIGNDVFSSKTYTEGTLYVPVGIVAKYQATAGWNKFATIKEIGEDDELQVGDLFTEQTIEGVTMTFMVTSLDPMECQVGDGTQACIDKATTGDVTVPAMPRGFVTRRLGDYGFAGCSKVEHFWMNDSIWYIGAHAFDGCLTARSVDLPRYVREVAHNFVDHEMEIHVPATASQSVIEAVAQACESTGSTVSVSKPEEAALERVFIWRQVRGIDEHAFGNMPSVKEMVVDAENPYFDSRGNCHAIIRTEDNTLLFGCQNTFIPETVTAIAAYAFEGHNKLKGITIPAAVKSIGEAAFTGCDKMTLVKSLITMPTAIDDNTFDAAVYAAATLIVPYGTKARYASTDGWRNFVNIEEMEVTELAQGGGTSYDGTGGVDETTPLDGNVIGDVYYNIGSENGGYNANEGCITVTKPTADEQVEALEGQDIFGEDMKNNFTGIVFKVPAGKGTIRVTAKTTGSMVLKVKIGNAAPMEMELEGKLKATFPYEVATPSYVYIYAGQTAAGVKAQSGAVADGLGELKIYDIELSTGEDGIDEMTNDGLRITDTIYNLSGQRLSKPQRGVNIINGKKIVVK